MRSASDYIKLRYTDWLWPLLIASGLFFINIRPYHDWGDDFAQYLQEAKNFALEQPIEQSSYVFNPNFARIGPKVYPPGFPLLLSLLANEKGDVSILTAQYFITACCLVFGLFAYFLLLQGGIKRPWALATLFLLLYHPFLLQQKSEILSDIPFSAFFLAGIFMVQQARKNLHFILAGLLAGLCIATRSIGWVLPLMAVFTFVVQLVKRQPDYKLLLFSLVSAGSGALLNFTSGYYPGEEHGYSLLFTEGAGFLETLNANFETYLEGFETIWVLYGNNRWQILLLVLQKAMLGLLLLGFLSSVRQKPSFYTLAGLAYLGVLFIYPFTGGFRFLLPLLPLFFIWISKGTGLVRLNWITNRTTGIFIFTLLVLSYWPEFKTIKKLEKVPYASPQLPEAMALYNWLDDIPDKDVVLFAKPRALAYYTGQSCVATEPEANQPSFKKDLDDFSVAYLIESIDLSYPALEQYVETDSTLIPVYENFRFKVWERAGPTEVEKSKPRETRDFFY